MAQPLPIHSWKLIVPCEVSAVKLGAWSFIRNIVCLLVCALHPGTFVPNLQALKRGTLSYPFYSLRPQIGRASCRERGVDLGGRRTIKKKKKQLHVIRKEGRCTLSSVRSALVCHGRR